jgi:hypothetical protein
MAFWALSIEQSQTEVAWVSAYGRLLYVNLGAADAIGIEHIAQCHYTF